MPNNVFTDVFEGIKDTASTAASQISPLKILETGVKQVTGTQGQGGVDETTNQKQYQSQLSQMKAQDDVSAKIQMQQIRQNLQTMMQAPKKPTQELPKNISGAVGAPKTVEEFEVQQEKIKKEKKKLPDITQLFKLRGRGSGERHRGAAG